MMGPTLYQGKFARCQTIGDELEALYDINRARSYVLTYGDDPVVCAIGHEAYARWVMGYPDRALRTIRKIEVIARELKHPFSEAIYFLRAFMVEDALGDYDGGSSSADAMATLCEEHGFSEMGAVASARQAASIIQRGETAQGIESLRSYADTFRSLNAHAGLTVLLIRLAQVCGENGRIEEALKHLDEALDTMAKTGGYAFQAEAIRLKGEMLFKLSRTDEANACFHYAL